FSDVGPTTGWTLPSKSPVTSFEANSLTPPTVDQIWARKVYEPFASGAVSVVVAAPATSPESQTMVVPCVTHARHCRGGRPSRSIELNWTVGVFVVVTTDTGTPASSTASANVGLARESMSSHSSRSEERRVGEEVRTRW